MKKIYFKLDQEEKIKRALKKYSDEGLFEKHKLSYFMEKGQHKIEFILLSNVDEEILKEIILNERYETLYFRADQKKKLQSILKKYNAIYTSYTCENYIELIFVPGIDEDI